MQDANLGRGGGGGGYELKGGWEKGLLRCFLLNLRCLMQQNAGALKHVLKWVRRCLMLC